MAIRKNRNENGKRADFIGSNPHSYGDFFFISMFRFGIICLISKRVLDIVMANIMNKVSFILYICYDPHQYINTYRKSQTTSTKCQYQAAASNPMWW